MAAGPEGGRAPPSVPSSAGWLVRSIGRPVVELKPITPPPRPVTAADLDWLAERRVRGSPKTDAGTLVSEMRDEDWR